MNRRCIPINKRFVYLSLIVITVLFAFSYLHSYFYTNLRIISYDLEQYLIGAHVVRDGQIRYLYDYPTQKKYQDTKVLTFEHNFNGLLAFRCSPVTAYIYTPLTNLTYYQAFMVMIGVNITLVFLSIYITGRALLLSTDRILLFFISSFFTVCTWATYANAQVNGLILLIFSLIFLLFSKSKFTAAGLVSGLLWVKPQFLIALPLLTLIIPTKNHALRYVKGAAFSFVSILLLNYLLYGNDFLPIYLKFLISSENVGHGTELIANSNLLGLLSLFLQGNSHLLSISLIGSIITYLGLGTALLLLKNKVTLSYSYAITLLALPILNLHTMGTDLIVFLIPWIILLQIFAGVKGNIQAIYVTCLVFIVMIFPWFYTMNIGGISYITTFLFIIFLLYSYRWLPVRIKQG